MAALDVWAVAALAVAARPRAAAAATRYSITDWWMKVKPPSSARTSRLPEPTMCAAWLESSWPASPRSVIASRAALVVAASSDRLITWSVVRHSRSASAVTASWRSPAVSAGPAPGGRARASS